MVTVALRSTSTRKRLVNPCLVVAGKWERPGQRQRQREFAPARIRAVNAMDIISPQLAHITAEPFYRPVRNEHALFEAAFEHRLPVLLKRPTGCGTTRFVEYMAWKLNRPMVTVACHDDLTAADVVGRYLIVGGQTVWMDGPLAAAVRAGAICCLDEVVEARKDTLYRNLTH